MNIKEMLMDAGFTEDQAEVLADTFSLQGHTHPVDSIIGLEDAIEEAVEEQGEEEEGEEEEGE